jgi:thymidylate synthase ThyX
VIPEAETFTDAERARLAPHVTNLDGPVFALVNLPEVVKGALFARYSRSAKSLRRLFLDEFASGAAPEAAHLQPDALGVRRAEALYERVFLEYGDDSVAQLGGVHLACEGVSNVLTKLLEWGRLMAYLEQSTRYVPYADRPGGRYRYHVPAEVATTPLAAPYVETMDALFGTYAGWLEPVQAYWRARHPRQPTDSDLVYRNTIRAKALDTLRGLLPAATTSNLGLYGTAQAYELLLLRMRGHALPEVRAYAELMVGELRKVIPSFLTRLDRPDRGGEWTAYLAGTGQATAELAERLFAGVEPEPRPAVTLVDFDPDGEDKLLAAMLYPHLDLPDDQILARVRTLSADERQAVADAYVGERRNRRHKPGRALEHLSYRFDVLSEYGAFRDLQRHRMLTIQWQTLSPRHGYVMADDVMAAGAAVPFEEAMATSAALYDALEPQFPAQASYAVSLAYRLRYSMELNARAALHMLELRTSPAGHPSYRRICQDMHHLIATQAGHRIVAGLMRFVDHSEAGAGLERLPGERRAEARRTVPPGGVLGPTPAPGKAST